VLTFWFFQKFQLRENDSKSVLGRLKNDKEGRKEHGILYMKQHSSSNLYSWYGKDVCITPGHDASLSSNGKCICRKGWSGKRCGIPQKLRDENWMKDPNLLASMQIKKEPRRIIYILSDFFYDFTILELNLKHIGDMIDVFIISEDQSLYSYRNGSLLSRFQDGYLSYYQDRFLYVNLTNLDSKSSVDKLHYTVDQGLRLVSDMRPDDVILFATPQDIYSKKFLIFLKVFHNYPLPIHCKQEKYLYGLYYKLLDDHQLQDYNSKLIKMQKTGSTGQIIPAKNSKSKISKTSHYNDTVLSPIYGSDDWPNTCAISVHTFSLIFEGKVKRLNNEEHLYKDKIKKFYNNLQQPLFPWIYPTAGISCHLCATNTQIFYKLQRLHDTRTPNWFVRNDLENNLEYISLLKAGGLDEYRKGAVPGSDSDKYLDDIGNRKFEMVKVVMHLQEVL